MKKLISIAVTAVLVISCIAPAHGASASYTAPWADAIPELLAAGAYEEGVVIAGIDMTCARRAGDPSSALEEKELRAGAEELMTVDAEALPDAADHRSDASWLRDLKDALTGGSGDEVCITVIRRTDMTTAQLLQLLAEDDSVIFAEPNYIADLNTETGANPGPAPAGGTAVLEGGDPAPARDLTALQWSSSADATFHALNAPENVSMNVPGWPDGSNMEHEIIVAVLDYPVDFSNPDLEDRAYTFSPELQETLHCDEHGFNATWESTDGKLELFEGGDHGTHVAGIIAASWDGEGVSGVASDARIVSVQIANDDGRTSLVNVLRAMNFVSEAKQNGVDIRLTNNSWEVLQNSKAIDAAVTELGENGIVSFFAAGNDAQDLNAMQHIQSTLADNPYAIIVASADVSGRLADTSNYGTGIVTLAAPGVDILSCVTDQNYIPAMAGVNTFYEGFENDSAALKIYQVDPETGEKINGTDGTIVHSDEAMGFEGEHVIRVPIDHDCAKDVYGDLVYTLRVDFSNVEGLELAAEDSFGFAFGGVDEIEIVEVSGLDAGFFGLWSHRGSWALYSGPLAEMEPSSRPSLTIDMIVGSMDEVYFDAIGLGSETHPYGLKSGTSMACPAAAGAAAVIASRHYDELSELEPAASAEKLAGYVRASVRPMPALADKVSTGGIIDLSVDEAAAEPAARPTPDITDVSVSGRTVTLTGTGFGNGGGTAAVKKYVVGKESAVISSQVAGWSDSLVTLSLGRDFEGIIEAELTASNGKKDTIVKFISKSGSLFETDLAIESDTGDPFAFDAPAGSDPEAVRMGDSESSGIMTALDGRLYYMPAVAEVENEPAYRTLYCYDPAADSWTGENIPVYPAWITFVSAAAFDGKLYVKGTPTDVDEGENIPYYDEYALGSSGEVCIYSYTPGEDSWQECSADHVFLEQSLFSTDDGLMLAGSVFIKDESEGESGHQSDSIWEYDPETGAGEIVGALPDWLSNPIVTYAFGHICITDEYGFTIFVLGDDLSKETAMELDMPLNDGSLERGILPDPNDTCFSLAGNKDMLVLIWSDVRTGAADTFILREGARSFSPYEMRVSDAAVFGPAAAILNGRLYVAGSSVFEPGKRIFRSTLLGKPVIAHSSGSSSNTGYAAVNVANGLKNGTVKVSSTNARAGMTVTVIPTPAEGYKTGAVKVTDQNGKEIAVTDNGDGTYSFTMPNTPVTITPVFEEIKPDDPNDPSGGGRTDVSDRFADVSKTAWYHDAVQWAVEKGITTGTDETHFSPMASCTRAQMVTFLWRAAGSPEPGGTASQFTDVVQGSYYEKAVAWAVENGITNGVDETRFAPNATVTRGQCVTFLCRALDGKAEGDNPFTDVTEGAYCCDAVLWAVANGVTKGVDETRFAPNDDCTRAQVVTFLYRAMGQA